MSTPGFQHLIPVTCAVGSRRRCLSLPLSPIVPFREAADSFNAVTVTTRKRQSSFLVWASSPVCRVMLSRRICSLLEEGTGQGCRTVSAVASRGPSGWEVSSALSWGGAPADLAVVSRRLRKKNDSCPAPRCTVLTDQTDAFIAAS